jgi:hypothetical protein
MSAFFCVLFSCIGRGLAKCLNEFIFSEVNSESEQARELNSQNVQQEYV